MTRSTNGTIVDESLQPTIRITSSPSPFKIMRAPDALSVQSTVVHSNMEQSGLAIDVQKETLNLKSQVQKSIHRPVSPISSFKKGGKRTTATTQGTIVQSRVVARGLIVEGSKITEQQQERRSTTPSSAPKPNSTPKSSTRKNSTTTTPLLRV